MTTKMTTMKVIISRRSIQAIAVGYALLAILSSSAQAADRLAVFDFETLGTGLNPSLGRAVAQILQVAFLKQGEYDIVERSRIKAVVEKQKLQMTGLVNLTPAFAWRGLQVPRWVLSGR